MASRACRPRRYAASAVLVLISVPMLVGFAALTIDVGVLYSTRADLQSAADASCLAGAATHASQAMMRFRMGMSDSESLELVQQAAFRQARSVCALHRTFGAEGIALSPRDVTVGRVDLASSDLSIGPADDPADCNAIQVVIRDTRNGSNSPVHLLLATLFRRHFGQASASAVAVLDDRFVSFDSAVADPDLWPFTMAVDDFERQFRGGADRYSYDESSRTVRSSGDGVREINLLSREPAAGNEGLLKIGGPNHSLGVVREQFLYGVQPNDVERETGAAVLGFYNSDGSATPYQLAAYDGLAADVEQDVAMRIGDVVAFFLHDRVEGSGASAVHRVTQLRFGRVMGLALQGATGQRGLWIQPVTYAGPGVGVSRAAPSSGGVAGRLVLVR